VKRLHLAGPLLSGGTGPGYFETTRIVHDS
jgi:hypothetical protein